MTQPNRILEDFAHDRLPARMPSTTEFVGAGCPLMVDGIFYRKP